MIIKLLWNTAVPLSLQVFKGHNGTRPKTEVVVTEKDTAERRVFSTAFPTASREVTTEKMAVRSGQRDALLTIFSAMAHARSEAMFDEQRTLLAQKDVSRLPRHNANRTGCRSSVSGWPASR